MSGGLQAKAEALFPTAAASLSRAPSLEFDEEDLFLNDGEGSTAAAATGSADPFVASGGCQAVLVHESSIPPFTLYATGN